MKMLVMYITNVLLGLIMTILGVYAMVQVYGWALFGWMIALGLIAQGLLWYAMYREGQGAEEDQLSAAVARAHREGE